ncbi:SRPBCC family protein [Micromonospora endolithica]|uniref:SRPBCC domain-containing protein n=1 Tax=Micromonospora endolithica TaxID=230091 RepID=A0A3A9ZL58_9ACTN|nr:SRPBCC domain-containing protein [Micromonospora endolithica]RKN48524.1 SRPBCC domain-containing protein [Micromonospora endolithica]TWJ24390.1 uncharacterized protein YndB with AHSA1/START domain [Micromonospora endolithica]
MSDDSFTTTFVVDRTPAEVFSAVTDVRGWWSRDIEGPTDRPGAEFTYHYQDIHRCRMRIVEFVPDQRIVWHCLENHFNFTDDKTEWTGTRISFDISREDEGTRLRFTHHGLTSDYECYDVCRTAWGGYVTESLRTLILTGNGDRDNEVRNAKALSQHR